MELKIKPKKQETNIIENIAILYSISVIMIIFFHINNYKIILDITIFDYFYNNFNIDSFYDEIELNYYILSFIDIILLLLFFKTGFNIINFDYKNSILYYSILSTFQFVKPIIIFYIYYNSILNNNLKLNVSILFNIFSVILNIISIKLIIGYKNIFDNQFNFN